MNSITSAASQSLPPSLGIPSSAITAFLRVVQDGTLHEIELALRKLRSQIDSVLLDLIKKLLMERDQGLLRTRCPCCSRSMTFNRSDGLTLQFLEGEISVLRGYLECRDCSIRLHPLDLELEVPEHGEVAPQFGHDLCLLGVELPAKAATRILKVLTGRTVHDEMIRDQIQRDGAALVTLEREEAEFFWPYDEKGNRREPPSASSLPKLRNPPPPDPEGAVAIEMDGVLVNLGRDPDIRKEIEAFEEKQELAAKQGDPLKQKIPSYYREVRQARIYRLKDVVTKKTKKGKIRRSIQRSETITVVNDPELFEKRAHAVFRAWRIDEYADRIVLGDGGDFIWDIASTHINPTWEVLDSRHAKSHIYQCANALYGAKSKEAKEWAKYWSHHLLKVDVEGLLEELERLSPQEWSEEGARKLKNLQDYVTKHRGRSKYPALRQRGLPMASGAIESANRQIVGDRAKRAGMRWAKPSLQRLLSLRAALFSNNWSLVCEAIRQQHRRTWESVTPSSKPESPLPQDSSHPLPPSVPSATPIPQNTTTTSQARPQASQRPLIPDRKRGRLALSGYVMPEAA